MRTQYLLEKEVDRVLGLLMKENRLALRVSLHTGLRIGDVLRLRTSQLKPQFWVTEAKTGKRKLVGLPGPLLRDLKRNAGSIWVFEHRTDPTKHRDRSTVWKDVKRAAVAMRLPQNIGPHSFRKVYAVELLHKYGDLEKVQRALNHSDSTTTLIYAMADSLMSQQNKRHRRG